MPPRSATILLALGLGVLLAAPTPALAGPLDVAKDVAQSRLSYFESAYGSIGLGIGGIIATTSGVLGVVEAVGAGAAFVAVAPELALAAGGVVAVYAGFELLRWTFEDPFRFEGSNIPRGADSRARAAAVPAVTVLGFHH